ncbi:hypothetical protein VNO77_02554 [Canavalia gladiata]|uniref:Uncharacterized protein n=1 Tax=Canavalia gladiata TaxID=3824 RepID=A0AAN9MYR2_CANGL
MILGAANAKGRGDKGASVHKDGDATLSRIKSFFGNSAWLQTKIINDNEAQLWEGNHELYITFGGGV